MVALRRQGLTASEDTASAEKGFRSLSADAPAVTTHEEEKQGREGRRQGTEVEGEMGSLVVVPTVDFAKLRGEIHQVPSLDDEAERTNWAPAGLPVVPPALPQPQGWTTTSVQRTAICTL